MKAKKSEQESVKDIMGRVSHTDLLSFYLHIDSLPVLINSPLRVDNHPSFFIYSPDGVRVLYKDYATGEKGDIYNLLMQVRKQSFSELLHSISSEKAFVKNFSDNTTIYRRRGRVVIKRSSSEVRVKVREWEDHDIKYWNTYGIPIKWLKYADVYPISHKIVYKDNSRYVFHAAKYAYVFVERKEGTVSLKIYQPLSHNYKWCTSNNKSVVGLWTKIPEKGERLVICSSLKDALCLWANTGIPSLYVQSETVNLSNTAQEVLKGRYKHIFICFDNDPPGIEDSKRLAKETGFKNIILPEFDEGKDISDFYKARGKEEFIRTIKPLFEIDGEQENQECHKSGI